MPSSSTDSPSKTTSRQEDDKEELPPVLKEPICFHTASFTPQQMKDLAYGDSYEARIKAATPVSQVKAEQVLAVAPMTWAGSIASTAVLAFGAPVGVFNVPILLYLIGKFAVGNVGLVFKAFGLGVFLPLAILPQGFHPWTLQSWLSLQMLKYFSFTYVLEEFPKPNRPRIMVGPPHGVFPYGCLLTMIVHPTCTGQICRGLAARAAVAFPIFKQLLRTIGIVDANRVTAQRVLEKPSCLGISTGGVAEIFETNNDDEVILLKERVGLIKLAIRTGADLTPCYIFGTTSMLQCWTGEGIPGGRDGLQRLSRKLGFGLILIFGRWMLPIPNRTPTLGVVGKTIETMHMKCDHPTDEQVQEIQEKLIQRMQEVFDTHKHLYGWEKKHLIIK